MPTVLPGLTTVVLAPPPKSVPSSLTASQLMLRKPPVNGWATAPLSTPPTAASKPFRADVALAVPTPVNESGVPAATGLPGDSIASTTDTELVAELVRTFL